MTPNNLDRALQLFNDATANGEQYYCPLTKEGFSQLFLQPVKNGDHVFAIYEEQEKGFIIGHYDGGIRRFFLTMIEVDPLFRRNGIGTFLVEELEDACRSFAKEQDLPDPVLEISYYNPTMIRWDLPGTDHHYHNNAQGVLLGSPAHIFFKNLGFRDIDYQNTYYQRLDQYVWPQEKMAPYEKRLQAAGYSIEWYDPEIHTDAEDLLKDLNNDLWSRQIPEELSREGGPRPLPILNDHGKIAGFAGPIVVEPTRRAWVLGVAVHSRCRGCGAATLLFNHMCEELKKAGAVYFSFFTAENNFARNIYEGAGFRIYTCWATMRRSHKIK